MALDTEITSLNFNDSLIGKRLNDKKTGVDVIFGYVSGMSPEHYDLSQKQGGVAIALMDRGMGQAELDRACQSLAEQCLGEDFELLITKGDLPFDARWYLIGDLTDMLNAAEQDRISLPFSDFLYDEALGLLEKYKS